MSDRREPDAEDPPVEPDRRRGTDHLVDLPDGSGCTEIWEHLSDRRTADDD